jgi:D-beta-D-heptose 7-phosphate kinase/D-beta-D-heptose 1-phosphate adenosyltransferase
VIPPPVVGQRERSRVLAAMAEVDAAVIFCEPAPLELMVATRPDVLVDVMVDVMVEVMVEVLVEGGDYQGETVAGAEQTESRRGQVKIVPIVDGDLTRRLIERGAGS